MHVHTDTHMQVSLEAEMFSTHPACPVGMLITLFWALHGWQRSLRTRPFQLQCMGPRGTWDLALPWILSRTGLNQDPTLNGPLALSQLDRKRRTPLSILEAKLLGC